MRRNVIRLLWIAVVVVIVVSMVAMDRASPLRLGLFTVLSWLAAPISFVIVPTAYATLDGVDNTRALDLLVGSAAGLAGYTQWFVVLSAMRRKLGRRH